MDLLECNLCDKKVMMRLVVYVWSCWISLTTATLYVRVFSQTPTKRAELRLETVWCARTHRRRKNCRRGEKPPSERFWNMSAEGTPTVFFCNFDVKGTTERRLFNNFIIFFSRKSRNIRSFLLVRVPSPICLWSSQITETGCFSSRKSFLCTAFITKPLWACLL